MSTAATHTLPYCDRNQTASAPVAASMSGFTPNSATQAGLPRPAFPALRAQPCACNVAVSNTRTLSSVCPGEASNG